MVRSRDRFPGEREEEGIVFERRPVGEEPTDDGGVRYVEGQFQMKDDLGVFNPRNDASGLDEAEHRLLDTLVHALAENAYTQLVFTGSDLTGVIVWTDVGMTTKIRETTLSYSGGTLIGVSDIQYESDGTTIREQLNTTPAYSGGDLVSLTDVLAIDSTPSVGSPLSEASHRALDTLVHELAEDSYTELTFGSGLLTAVTTWTDSGKTTKIRETLLTYTGSVLTQVESNQYDASGLTVVDHLISTPSYSSGDLVSITEAV